MQVKISLTKCLVNGILRTLFYILLMSSKSLFPLNVFILGDLWIKVAKDLKMEIFNNSEFFLDKVMAALNGIDPYCEHVK